MMWGDIICTYSTLYDKTGVFTYDPGFTSTASCHSAITYIDGPVGVLLHGGYAIEDLAAYSDFDDVSYVLLYGDLPSARQKVRGHHNGHPCG